MALRNVVPDLGLEDISLPEFVCRDWYNYGDKIAIIEGTTRREYTYKELLYTVRSLAHALWRRGLRKGKLLAIVAPNIPEFITVALAAMATGASVAGINNTYTTGECRTLLNLSGANFIFTTDNLASKIGQSSRNLSSLQDIVVTNHAEDCVSLNTLLDEGVCCCDGQVSESVPSICACSCEDCTCCPRAVINPRDDVALVFFSSGTTGLPKGVMLTHFNLVSNALQSKRHGLLNERTAALAHTSVQYLPMFHIYGFSVMTRSLTAGLRLVSVERYKPQLFLQLIQDYRVAVLWLVPPVANMLATYDDVGRYDLSCVIRMNSSGAAIGKETEKKLRQRFPHAVISQSYGLTETSPTSLRHPVDDHADKSVGKPLQGVECKIVDEATLGGLGVNQTGELWLRGPNIMAGYLNNPQATADAIDRDGWFHTGDIGHYDEHGHFYITDRKKELIKYKAFQVAPAELEDLLLHCPGVSDVAVIGIEDAVCGELPKAFVVKQSGSSLTEDEVKNYIAERLSSFKHLHGGVDFVGAIPRTSTGKIQRRLLKKKRKDTLSKL